MKLCPCGSGHTRRDLVDQLGIFCAFVFDRCETQKRASFNPAIFDGPYPSDETIDAEPGAATSYGHDENW